MAPATEKRQLFIASHRGFCNGVFRALKIVREVLEQHRNQRAVYVYHEIVHNNFVVEDLKKQGVIFVDDLNEVPDDAVLIWSAHGVSPALKKQAAMRSLQTVDATCPLVQKLHRLAAEHSAAGDLVIFIGHAEHPETLGVLGCGNIHCVSDPADCAALPPPEPEKNTVVLTQTTWNREDIAEILQALGSQVSGLQVISDICYATSERQQAVRELITERKIEMLLVIGSPASSNSRRLCEVAQKYHIRAELIDDPQAIRQLDLNSVTALGITAGASAPESLLQSALEILQNQYNFTVYEE